MKELLTIAALYLTALGAVILHGSQSVELINERIYTITDSSGQNFSARVLLPNDKTGLRDTLFVGVDDPGLVWRARDVVWSKTDRDD